MSDYNLKTPERPVGLLQAVEKLMYWAQVSLPAVYGEELTYAKEQGKMAAKINEIVEQLNVNTQWTEYLLNEGVENETITYINMLVENGTLGNLINNTLLKDIQDGLNDQINSFENEINNKLISQDQKINSVVTPSPVGVYPNISSIPSSADKNRIYVTSNDGKWVYWNGSAWTAGGTYQATAIGDNEVTIPKLNRLLYAKLNQTTVWLIGAPFAINKEITTNGVMRYYIYTQRLYATVFLNNTVYYNIGINGFRDYLEAGNALVIDLTDYTTGTVNITVEPFSNSLFNSEKKVILLYNSAGIIGGCLNKPELFHFPNSIGLIGVPTSLSYSDGSVSASWSRLYYYGYGYNQETLTGAMQSLIAVEAWSGSLSQNQALIVDFRDLVVSGTNNVTPKIVNVATTDDPSNNQISVMSINTGRYGLLLINRNGIVGGDVIKNGTIASKPVPIEGSSSRYVSCTNNNLIVYYSCAYDKNTFIGYGFNRYIDETKNTDIYRINDLKVYTYNGSQFIDTGMFIVKSGEWEMAVKQSGAPDFIGGRAHGNEKMTSWSIEIDGKEPTDGVYAFNEINIMCVSTMYSQIDQSEFGTHYKHYIFNDKLTVKQNVIFNKVYSLQKSYLAMLPINRYVDSINTNPHITSEAYNYQNYAIQDISLDGHQAISINGNTGYVMYNKLVGQKPMVRMKVNYPNALPNNSSFISGDALYNKVYFDYCGDNYTTKVNEKWEVITTYDINYSGATTS